MVIGSDLAFRNIRLPIYLVLLKLYLALLKYLLLYT